MAPLERIIITNRRTFCLFCGETKSTERSPSDGQDPRHQSFKIGPQYPVVHAGQSRYGDDDVKFTGGKEAVWGTFNAARSWPFKSNYAEDIPSGNPLDISGATIAVVCDRIAVPRSKTILNFLKQVNDDEVKNTEYAHAPFYQVIDALCDPIDEDDTRSYLERQRDAEAILPATRRQVFNWLPPAMPPPPGYQGLQMLEMLPRMDNGATLSGFLGPDRKHLALGFMWDAEHLSYREAEEAIDLVVRLVEAMGKEENWSLTVGDILRM